MKACGFQISQDILQEINHKYLYGNQTFTIKFTATSPKNQWVNLDKVTVLIKVKYIDSKHFDKAHWKPITRSYFYFTCQGRCCYHQQNPFFSWKKSYSWWQLKLLADNVLPNSSSSMQNKVVIVLTHWGRATHICVGKLTTIDSDNGLSPGRRQAIIWTIAGILLIGPLGTNFSEILMGIQTFSFKKMHLKMSPAKWRSFVSASMC